MAFRTNRPALLLCVCFSIGFILKAQLPSFKWAAKIGTYPYFLKLQSAVDRSGNIYTMGVFRDSVDFNPGPSSYKLRPVGGDDVFVSKLNADGAFIWVRQIGGNGQDVVFDMAIDPSDNVLLTGHFEGTVDFDPGPDVFNLVCPGYLDAFVLKLDSSGRFIWARKFDGMFSEQGKCIAADDSGNVFTCGNFSGNTDFDPGAGTYSLTAKAATDMYVSKLSASGDFIWARSIGAIDQFGIKAIAVDVKGNPYIAGQFQNTVDFDPGSAAFQLSSFGNSDVFLLKLNAKGQFEWVDRIGGKAIDEVNDLCIGASGHLYMTGFYSDSADLDPASLSKKLYSVNGPDVFILKLDSAGQYVWARSLGGNSADQSFAIYADQAGNVFSTGYFRGTADFDPGIKVFTLKTKDGSTMEENVFISKLNSNGNFVWALNFGASYDERGYDIKVKEDGRIICTGSFMSTVDFDCDTGKYFLSQSDLQNRGLFVLNMQQPKTVSVQPPHAYRFKVYPNPAASTLRLEWPEADAICGIRIFSADGSLLASFQNVKSASEIDISRLSPGLYVLLPDSNGINWPVLRFLKI